MASSHSHSHAHSHHDDHHGHHHHGDPHKQGRTFLIAIILNLAFVAVEFSYGFIANSTALLADAGHNLSDVLGLALAWGAYVLGRRAPSERFTYGLRSSTILAALANAMLLFVACGAIAWEAIGRFQHPEGVAGATVSVVAAIGIVINGFSAWLFMRGSKEDINVRGAYLHMAADAAISLGVVVAGLIILYSGAQWIDPLISLVIVLVILWGTWGLLRESVGLAMAAVPASVDLAGVQQYLRQLPGVVDVHDLHVWGMSTTESALTVHLVVPSGHPGDEWMDEVVMTLRHHHGVHHATLQIEYGTTAHACALHEPHHDHDHEGHDHGHPH